jgi:hypothetical protein
MSGSISYTQVYVTYRRVYVIVGCICLVYAPSCFTDCVGVVHWLYVPYPDVLLLLASRLLLLLLYVLLLAEYCWLAAWCPAVLTAPAHVRCLATLSKCASVYPKLMLASPAWPSHPIRPTCCS